MHGCLCECERGTWHSSCPTCRGSTDSWAQGAHPPLLLRPVPHLFWPLFCSHTFSMSHFFPHPLFIPYCPSHIGPVSQRSLEFLCSFHIQFRPPFYLFTLFLLSLPLFSLHDCKKQPKSQLSKSTRYIFAFNYLSKSKDMNTIWIQAKWYLILHNNFLKARSFINR